MTHERKDSNTVNKEIPLTRCMFAIVDIEDYNNISGYKWYSRNHRGLFYDQSSRKPVTLVTG